jgi:hypothetical protein
VELGAVDPFAAAAVCGAPPRRRRQPGHARLEIADPALELGHDVAGERVDAAVGGAGGEEDDGEGTQDRHGPERSREWSDREAGRRNSTPRGASDDRGNEVSDLDDRPTPELGYPVQPAPRRHVRTDPRGVPIEVAERPSGPLRRRAPTDELEVEPELARAIDVHLHRKTRLLRWIAGAALTLALGAIGGAMKAADDGARAQERDRVQLEVLRDEVSRIRARLDSRASLDRHSPATPAVKGTP